MVPNSPILLANLDKHSEMTEGLPADLPCFISNNNDLQDWQPIYINTDNTSRA